MDLMPLYHVVIEWGVGQSLSLRQNTGLVVAFSIVQTQHISTLTRQKNNPALISLLFLLLSKKKEEEEKGRSLLLNQ
jgi:hypothetical protein